MAKEFYGPSPPGTIKLPGLPGTPAQRNYVRNLIINPCEADWMVYAKTFLPVAGLFFLALLDFGASDIARGALTPQTNRTGRHSKRRPGKGGKARGLPEIGNAFGRVAGSAVGLNRKHGNNSTDFFFKVDSIGQLSALSMLVGEASLDGLVLWTSLVMDIACRPDTTGSYVMRQGPTAGALGILGWQGMLVSKLIRNFDPKEWETSPGFIGNRDRGFTVSTSATYFNPNLFPIIVQHGFWIEAPITADPDVVGAEVIIGPFDTAEVEASGQVNLPGGAIFGKRSLGGNAFGTGGAFAWAT